MKPSLSCIIYHLLESGQGLQEVVPSLSVSSVFYLSSILACICLNSPLVFRTQAVGSGSMVSRAGSIVAPFSVNLSSIWIFIPQVFNHFIET